MMVYTKKYGTFFLFLACFISPMVFSATTISSSAPSSFYSKLAQGHLMLELGGYQGTQGETQHINIKNLIGDTFTHANQNKNNVVVGLGYFVDGKSWNSVHMSYGINAFYLAPITVSGDVIQEDIFTNLSYSYALRHFPIYAMIKSVIDLKSPNYAVTLDAGMGPNFMKAYSFSESSLDGGITIPEHPFSANTTTTFSATVGVGLKINHALAQLPVECGYRFFYLGRGHLTANNSQVLDNLSTGNTYANAILCSVSI